MNQSNPFERATLYQEFRWSYEVSGDITNRKHVTLKQRTLKRFPSTKYLEDHIVTEEKGCGEARPAVGAFSIDCRETKVIGKSR